MFLLIGVTLRLIKSSSLVVRINLFQGLGAATLKGLSINLAFHRDIGRIKILLLPPNLHSDIFFRWFSKRSCYQKDFFKVGNNSYYS